MGIEPGPELRELEAAVLAQAPALAGPAGPRPRVRRRAGLPFALEAVGPSFVGRAFELGRLSDAWHEAAAGRGGLVALFGPEGAGKTRLAAELARRAEAEGSAVCYGRCTRDDGAPEALVGQLLAESGLSPGDVASVAGDLTGPGPAAALARVLGDWAGDNAVLAVVDDLDEAAAGTVALVAELGQACQHLPVLVVAAAEASRERLPAPLDRLDPSGAAIHLGGLSLDEIVTLGSLYLPGDWTAADAEAVLRFSGGRPRSVHEQVSRVAQARVSTGLAEAAEQAERTRSGLVVVQAGLAERVAGLQAIDERRRSHLRPVEREGQITPGPPVCPYKGLARFEADDAPYFFGRERLVATLTARLVGADLLVVSGPSGSGKSSLVRAGLLPALAQGALPGSRSWQLVTLCPGPHPVDELRRRLAVPRGASARRVVFVDQLEELFTACDDPGEREAFVADLLALASADLPTTLIVAVRSDELGRCAEHPELAERMAGNNVLVGPMSDYELGRAVEGPARRSGLEVEPGLVDAVVTDVADRPGALPLLSTAVLETWERRQGRILTLAGYREAGGVEGAVARLAESAYARLNPTQQRAARRLLLHLADVEVGRPVDLRRRVPLAEILSADDADAAVALDVLVARRLVTVGEGTAEVTHEALLREWPRLAAWLDEDREGRRLHRQLTDAASGWQSEGRDPAALYRGSRLAAAEEWSAAHPGDANALEREFLDTSLAAQDATLQAARHTARRLRRLTVGVGAIAAVALVAGGLALTQRDRATHQTAAARRAAIDAVAGRLAAEARSLPASQLDLAMLLAVQSRHLESSTATDGALETVLVHTPPGLDGIVQLGAPAGCGTASVDGRFAAGATVDGYVHLIDVSSGRTLRTLPKIVGSRSCASLAFSTDGNRLIASGTTGDTVVWDTATGHQIGAVIKVPSASAKAGVGIEDAFELRPGRLVTSTGDGMVILWDTTDPAHPSRVAVFNESTTPGPYPSVQLADLHNPNRIAVGTSAGTHVWDITSHTLAYPTLPGLPVAESPDGSTLVTATQTQFLLWDVTTGKPRGDPLSGITPAEFEGAFFSPDGTRLAVKDSATASAVVVDLATRRRLLSVPISGSGGPGPFLADGRLSVFAGQTMTLWRIGVTSPAPFATRLGEPGPDLSLFTPDRSKVITVGPTGLHAWDPTTGAPLAPPLGGRVNTKTNWPPGAEASFSADGALLAWSPGDGTVTLWDLGTGRRVGNLDTGAPRAFVTWAPRGRTLGVAAPGGAMNVWNLTDPAHPVRLADMTAPGFDAGATPGPLFSPDGRLLAAEPLPNSSNAGYFPISIFDASSGKLVRTMQPNAGAVRSAAFSPDSQTLAVPVWDTRSLTGRVVLYDVATGRSRGTLFLPYISNFVAFAGGGRWLVTSEFNLSYLGPYGSPSGRVDLWDSATLTPIGEPLTISGGASHLATDQPGGYRITTATGYTTGTPTVLNLDPSNWQATACRLAGRNLTRAEWAQYIPGRPYETTCPQWPAGA
jgi:WD40 repeat protein